MREILINMLGGISQQQAVEMIEELIPQQEPVIMREFIGFNELNKQRKNK